MSTSIKADRKRITPTQALRKLLARGAYLRAVNTFKAWQQVKILAKQKQMRE